MALTMSTASYGTGELSEPLVVGRGEPVEPVVRCSNRPRGGWRLGRVAWPGCCLAIALTALLLASVGAKALPSEDYVVLPSLAEGRAPTAVLHHYVAHSKRSYFQHGWRHVLHRLHQPA